MTVRVAMWSGPRNISTAMMRSWENRPDTTVVDEPFYAAYLQRTGLDHPARDQVIASQPTDPDEVVQHLREDDSAPVHYAKHMTHHILRDWPLDWVTDFRNVLLIRDPTEVVASYIRSREDVRARGHRPAPAGAAARRVLRGATGHRLRRLPA